MSVLKMCPFCVFIEIIPLQAGVCFVSAQFNHRKFGFYWCVRCEMSDRERKREREEETQFTLGR